MSNVVSLYPQQGAPQSDRFAGLMMGVAQGRRRMDDVFWLKENAELLGVLCSGGVTLAPSDLAPYTAFYETLEERLHFFPQYYRFLLSICLDLEDLGFAGDLGARLCGWVADQGLAEGELSDLQRAEARRLLARRDVIEPTSGPLDQRLHRFAEREATFAMPNKKAAYELVHIVFYLSEYGRRDPALGPDALISLEYAGLLAYLDQNADLLAEVCAALRFAGATPSPLWEAQVAQYHRAARLSADQRRGVNDDFHAYLVTGWAMQVAGLKGFAQPVPSGALRFDAPHMPQQGALRSMSECLFDLGSSRSDSWAKMRARVMPYLGNAGQDVLRRAEASSDHFESFFAGFARAV